jgi:hypothetical protein
MQEQVTNSQSEKEYQSGRTGAMVFAGIVYAGVVIASTTLFINFILTAFPNNAFGSRVIMTVAGLMVGASMLAFPIALHKWAVSGWHRYIAIGLYFGEMIIVGINSIVSFAALLFKHTGAVMPAWVQWYEPFSIISIIYTLGAWGIVFLTDPAIRRRAAERAAKEKFYDKVQAKLDEFLDTVEGEEAVERVAVAKIQEKFNPDLNKKRHWGNGQLEENQVLARLPQASRPALPVRREYTTQDLCDLWDMNRNGLINAFDPYPSPAEALAPFKVGGFMPQDMTLENFSDIYYDLFPKRLPSYPKVAVPKWECMNCHSINTMDNRLCTACSYSRDHNGVLLAGRKNGINP